MGFLLEDDRQKGGKHVRKHEMWDAMGVTIVRHRMEVGDYMSPPPVVVDTKNSLVELGGNLRTDHERFRSECVKAQDMGTILVILTENEYGVSDLNDLSTWREPAHSVKKRKGKQPYNGATMAKQCATMRDRYGVMFDFCTPDESARRVIDILERGEKWVWERRLSSTRSED